MNDLPTPGANPHPRYSELLTAQDAEARRARAFVAEVFRRAEPYLDAHLARDLPIEFPSRLWEMIVATMLLDAGVGVCRRKDRPIAHGPDLLLEDGTTWVEAVSVGPGTGADALAWPTHFEGARYIPDERISLRFLSAIREKRDKAQTYLAKGTIKASDRYIIALNGGEVPWVRKDQTIPRILRTLFPIGPLEVLLDVSTGAVTGSRYAYRPEVTKDNGSRVSTDWFLSPESAVISAVLYACVDEYNLPEPLCDGLHLVHNPSAKSRLPEGLIARGREYLPRDEVIDVRNYRGA